MAGPDDLVAAACGVLAGYMPVLERLLAEPAAEPPAPGVRSRAAETPEPWYTPAGRALMDAHEGIRRLEASLRAQVTGSPGLRRGGSDAATAATLAAIPKLAAAVDGDDQALAARIIDRWINAARAVHGIDEARRWRPLPRHPGGGLPPRCPNCGTFQLRADVEARVVMCWCPGCRDRNGVTPVASMETGPDGRPRLAWADGLTETAPDMEAC